MSDPSYLTWSPLLSVAVWGILSGYLVFRQRYRTWTERFFLGLCLGTAAYAASDVFFFQQSPAAASTAITTPAVIGASASLASLTVASLFLFYYGASLYSRFRRAMLAALAPTVVFLGLFPTVMFVGFGSTTGPNPVIIPDYNSTWLVPWAVWIGFLWIAGLYGVTRTFLEIRRQNPKLSLRIGAILASLAVAVVAGATTNLVLALYNTVDVPPLFSTFLALPGIVISFAVSPSALKGLNDAILRRKASAYDAKGAFLTFSDGTLIGSKTVPEEEMIDADSFSATLDVIQNFMRTSFPTLKGKWLKSIRHGDYTLVLERGRYAYLTLVIAGSENDELRRRMIEHLETFEDANGGVLENWRGVAKDAVGVDSMLGALLSPA